MKQPANFFELPEEEQRRIIEQAAKDANEAEAAVMKNDEQTIDKILRKHWNCTTYMYDDEHLCEGCEEQLQQDLQDIDSLYAAKIKEAE
jgi:TRAP-type C4-dicarboxylate transport system substrate-binding protein